MLLKIKIVLLCSLWNLVAYSQNLRIAVAANAQFVIRSLAADFLAKTGIRPEIITGSSGKLTAQIQHGAPYDIFLSADMDYPQKLYDAKLSKERPKVYALGSLIVCSKKQNIKIWKKTLLAPGIKIAIANPRLAPYGEAAKHYLTNKHLWESAKNKVVLGESISQVNTYIINGVVDLGFTAEALVYESNYKETLSWTRIPKKDYPPIKQGMVLLKRAENNAAAKRFYNYMGSITAKHILRKFGYQTL